MSNLSQHRQALFCNDSQSIADYQKNMKTAVYAKVIYGFIPTKLIPQKHPSKHSPQVNKLLLKILQVKN